jgi:hypothetical protein
MAFYGISFTHLYKQSARWQDVLERNTIKLHVGYTTSLPEDKHWDVQKHTKDTTIKLKH